METPQKQTFESSAKSWDELVEAGENPINYIGTPLLDETTVPEEKRDIYDTIIAAEHSAIEAEAESAAASEAAAVQDKRAEFLREREKARHDMSNIAVRGSLAAAINEQPSRREAVVSVGTYQTGYMSPKEVEDVLEARRNGEF